MSKKVLAIVAVIALVAVLGVMLCACNASSYEKKLSDAGYEVKVYDKDSDEVAAYNKALEKDDDYSGEVKWVVSGVKASLSLTKGVDAGAIEIVKFSKIADAKQYVKDMTDDEESDTIVRKGSIVFIGDKASIELVA